MILPGRLWLLVAALVVTACGHSPERSSEAEARRPVLTIPLQLRDHSGAATFFYEANRDPARWGFDLIHLPFDIARTEGFPVFESRVRYDGEGYRAVIGWIQLVTVRDARTGREETSIDQVPVLRRSDTPFTEFGPSATRFDAPGPNPPRANETWTAYTFLAICPDVGRTRRVEALLGVRWGYTLADGKPTLLPLERVGADAWDRLRPVLQEGYPTWEFLPGFGDKT